MGFTPSSPLLATLVERGFVKDCTDIAGLDAAMCAGRVPAYVGFDLTARALHVGSMIPLMVMRHMRAAAIAAGAHPLGEAIHAIHMLLGDATTRVGDPSDKDGARPILSQAAIAANWPGIRDCAWAVVGGPCREHFNSKWLDDLSFMDFLTGPARSMSLNRMISADVVARRLENDMPMTLMELIYQSMQAMDFVHLSHLGVRLQVGGSDQWTNILAGVELARRETGTTLFGFTTPLMTDASGRKMGKTAAGETVWLDASMTSPFELWQFWRNVPDEKVGEFLGLFTEIRMDEVRALAAGDIVEAKRRLATEAVAIVHGEDAAIEAQTAADAARALSSSSTLSDHDGGAFRISAKALESVPTIRCPVDPETTVITIAELLVDCGLAKSKGDARRLAAGGGVRFGGLKVEHLDVPVERRDFDNGALLLSVGRKRHVRVLPTDLGPSLRPVATRIVERNDGFLDIYGLYGEDREADTIASMIPTMERAIERQSRVRLATQNT